MINITAEVICDVDTSAAVVVATSPVLQPLTGATPPPFSVREGMAQGRVAFDAWEGSACHESCRREPKLVTVSLVLSGHEVDTIRLDAQLDFERTPKKDYNLKRNVVLRCKK